MICCNQRATACQSLDVQHDSRLGVNCSSREGKAVSVQEHVGSWDLLVLSPDLPQSHFSVQSQKGEHENCVKPRLIISCSSVSVLFPSVSGVGYGHLLYGAYTVMRTPDTRGIFLKKPLKPYQGQQCFIQIGKSHKLQRLTKSTTATANPQTQEPQEQGLFRSQFALLYHLVQKLKLQSLESTLTQSTLLPLEHTLETVLQTGAFRSLDPASVLSFSGSSSEQLLKNIFVFCEESFYDVSCFTPCMEV